MTGTVDGGRAPRRGHQYVDRGPLPGTNWDTPYYRPRLAAVSRLLRELHEAADRPHATKLGPRIGVSYTAVSQLLSGRRMPSWRVVRALGAVLAAQAGGDVAAVEAALRRMYQNGSPAVGDDHEIKGKRKT